MIDSRPTAIARHAEAAQRLLSELDRQAEAAQHALGHENGSDFFAAVDARDELLSELDSVVGQMTAAHRAIAGTGGVHDAVTNRLLSEMAQTAARALESHTRLAMQTRRERDRLGAALTRSQEPDAVATQYSIASTGARAKAFSVTG